MTEGWKSSNIRKQPSQFKILFRKKLRADWCQGMLAIFCIPVCYPKI